MKSIVKKGLIIFGGILVLLVLLIVLIFVLVPDNISVQIRAEGVLDKEGNVAALGKSVPIYAEYASITDDYSLGVVGTINDGKLDVVLPPIPLEIIDATEHGEFLLYPLGNDKVTLQLENKDGDIIKFWFFAEDEENFYGNYAVQGWNFVRGDNFPFITLSLVYLDGYKWVYYEDWTYPLQDRQSAKPLF